jgi:hypothetical protein
VQRGARRNVDCPALVHGHCADPTAWCQWSTVYLARKCWTADRGEIALGGCLVPQNPEWLCNSCGHTWEDRGYGHPSGRLRLHPDDLVVPAYLRPVWQAWTLGDDGLWEPLAEFLDEAHRHPSLAALWDVPGVFDLAHCHRGNPSICQLPRGLPTVAPGLRPSIHGSAEIVPFGSRNRAF